MFKAVGPRVQPDATNHKESQKYLQRLDDEDTAEKPKKNEAKNK